MKQIAVFVAVFALSAGVADAANLGLSNLAVTPTGHVTATITPSGYASIWGVEIATGSSRDSSGDFLVETRVGFEMPWNPPLFGYYDTAPRDYVSSIQLPKPGTYYLEAFGYDDTWQFVQGGSSGPLFSNIGTVTFCQTVVVTPAHYEKQIVKPAHYVKKLVKRAHWVWRHGKRIRVKAKYKLVYVPTVTRQVLVPTVTKQDCG